MKKLILVLCVVVTVLSCKNLDKKNKETVTDNSFKITIKGGEHFPEGSRVAIYRRKTEESPELTEYLKKEQFKDGKVLLEGKVDDVHMIAIDILPSDSEYPYNRIHLALEPGSIEIHCTDQKAYTLEGGKYNTLVINSWVEDPNYIETNAAYIALMDTVDFNKMTDEDKKKLIDKSGAVRKAKEIALEKAFKSTDDPLAQLLLYEIGYIGDKDPEDTNSIKRYSVMETLATAVGLKHRQAKVTMLGIKMMKDSQMASAQIGVGTIIKDFEAKNLKGETFHLADVLKKNKYVLVEFWASWCGPCRAEIPHMKKAYSRFKDKGFEIVSFTLDNKRERWEKASKEEQIPWIDTGDLLAFTSPVTKMYGVMGVPANYLVEASTGKIVARDLRQEKLDEKLEELLGK